MPERRSAEHQGVVSAIVEQVKYWFRERELLLRADGRVHFLRLTTSLQVAFVCVLMGVGVWGLAATATAVFQSTVLDEKSGEIDEAKLAFNALREDLVNYQAQIAELTQRMAVEDGKPAKGDGKSADGTGAEPTVTDTEKLARLSDRLESSLRKLSTDVDLSEAERDRIIQSRDMLRKRVVALNSELEVAREQRTQLQRRLTNLRGQLEDEEFAHRRASGQVEKLQTELTEVRGTLSKSDKEGRRLSQNVAKLSEELDTARRDQANVVSQREGLRERLAVAHRDLNETRQRAKDLEFKFKSVVRDLAKVDVRREHAVEGRSPTDVIDDEIAAILGELSSSRRRVREVEDSMQSVLAGLVAVTGDPDTPERRRIDPAVRARTLLKELEDIHQGQAAALQSLGDRTGGNIDEAEQILAMTGLNVDDLLAQIGMPSGLGGPLELADSDEPSLGNTVYALHAQVGRWEAIRQALRCIPLISPVDFYHVASGYGKRRDPFTNQLAMHRGIDLAGWPGSPVWAAAPGTVTRAGRWGRYGLMVEIDHGCGIKTRYGHLKKVLVKRGQTIGHREKVGLLGSTGRSTGPHVHYEVHYNNKHLDPSKFIKAGYHVFKG